VSRAAVTVVVVGDRPLHREGAVAALERDQSGIQVIGEASDAECVLSLVRRCRPEVLLTDLRLPGRDGIWLTGSVLDSNPKTRVLVVTGGRCTQRAGLIGPRRIRGYQQRCFRGSVVRRCGLRGSGRRVRERSDSSHARREPRPSDRDLDVRRELSQ
jgi:DNA-binding NarL/FixJ family response regulator